MYIVLPYPLYFLLLEFPVAFEKKPCETLHLTLLPVTSIGKKQKSPLPRVGPSVSEPNIVGLEADFPFQRGVSWGSVLIFGGVDIDAPSKIMYIERLSISQSPFLDTLLVN